MEKMFQSNWFVLLLLSVLFLAEWMSFSYFGNENSYIWNSIHLWQVIGIWIFLGVVIIIGSYLGEYKLRMQIVKRFLNNALGLRWLSFVFILAFLVHISLISNVFYAIVVHNQLVWYTIFIPVIGIIFLCAVFPVKNNFGEKDNDKRNKVLLISGISMLSKRSVELLFKPFEDYTGYSNIKQMAIILSDGLYKESEGGRKINMKDLEDLFSNIGYSPEEIKQNTETYVSCINNDQQVLKLKELLEKVLTRYFTVRFPHYPVPKFVFSQNYYNYDDFSSCYVGAGEEIKMIEKGFNVYSSKTLIHISPGTSIITGVLSLYGIKANRELVYTTQDDSRLISLNLDVWTLDELLNELWKELDEKKLMGKNDRA